MATNFEILKDAIDTTLDSAKIEGTYIPVIEKNTDSNYRGEFESVVAITGDIGNTEYIHIKGIRDPYTEDTEPLPRDLQSAFGQDAAYNIRLNERARTLATKRVFDSESAFKQRQALLNLLSDVDEIAPGVFCHETSRTLVFFDTLEGEVYTSKKSDAEFDDKYLAYLHANERVYGRGSNSYSFFPITFTDENGVTHKNICYLHHIMYALSRGVACIDLLSTTFDKGSVNVVHHLDGDVTNNSKDNLTIITRSLNSRIGYYEKKGWKFTFLK